ncbi:MAG: FtsW/RodA/SpoVE family cell cycle protein [Coriobacteriia bacterium]|nr:FtsW/RodA/SpoVE family cell cycle protein [Coriobacteriia bacterium]
MSSAGFESHSTGSNFLQNHASLFSKINFPFTLSLIGLIAFGLLVVYSASLTISDASLVKQLLGLTIGIILAIIIFNFDVNRLSSMTKMLLILNVVLLLSPLIPGLGVNAKGINGWIEIPIIHQRFQPAELAKIATILMMAGLVSQYNGKIEKLSDYLKLCGFLSVPFILILLQPDLGTGLILLVVGASIIIMGGAQKKWVLTTIAVLVGLVALVLITDPIIDATLGDKHSLLKDYQMSRLLVFVDPSIDPSGDGYNLQQSKIAVGSGGIFGKGIGNASQAGGGFLPEAHTDFVFALLAEEFGFVGVLLLLVLYLVLLLSTLYVALSAGSMFASLVCVGVAVMWGFQILQNIGMCVGIMPITGIPLPFISYGPSSMLTQVFASSFVASIYRYRAKVSKAS